MAPTNFKHGDMIWLTSGEFWDMQEPSWLENLQPPWLPRASDAIDRPAEEHFGGEAGAVVTGISALSAGDDTLKGSDADNTLYGDAGNDLIYGGPGNDFLEGGTGDDLLYGGEGNDYVSGGANGFTGDAGSDTLYGGPGDDAIAVRVTDFNETSVFGGNGFDIVYLDGGSGELTELQFDDTASIEKLFVTGSAISGTSKADMFDLSNIFVGDGSNAEVFLMGQGSDTFRGGAGNEEIDGGTGRDNLAGGAGDDLYIVDLEGDVVIEERDAGGDVVHSTAETYTLPVNVEALYLLNDTAQTGYGNGMANQISGGGAGKIIDGKGGNDSIYAGGGDDSLMGGDGNDVIYAGVSGRDSRGNDTLIGGAGTDTLYGGGGDDTYYLTGADVFEDSDGSNILYSDATKYWLYGKDTFISTAARGVNITSAAGANSVTTTQFNDTLNAGIGRETLIGLGGDDTYIITGDRATVVEVKGGGYDTVYTDLLTYVLQANVEALSGTQFASGVNFTGNGLNNALTGTGGADTLDGGTGRDTLSGGGGDDLYFTDHMGDVIVDTGVVGYDVVVTSLTAYAMEANLEAVFASAATGANLIGNAGDNGLSGFIGADTLSGGKGDDFLQGWLGRDLLTGGGGADLFVFDSALSPANWDTITDFAANVDVFYLVSSGPELFNALAEGFLPTGMFRTVTSPTGALEPDDHILYNRGTGQLFYDPDGSGGATAVQFALLPDAPLLSAADFYVSA